MEYRMHVRMHIHDESRMEMQEMPQDWKWCNFCSGSKKTSESHELISMLEGDNKL